MTSDITTRPPVALPETVGQATAIEQSRAVAEVAAAVQVAQAYPRDTQAALREMREVCRLKSMADRAFFAYPKAGSTVTGPTVHLARELARIWGNIQYSSAEMARSDVRAESEMQAVAWDLQTNARAAQIHIVPHKMDTKRGVKVLTDMRDIYENNANMGARRLRAVIFAVLPSWFVDEAVDLCNATLEDGGGVPLAHRIASIVDAFAGLDITTEQLEANRGKPSARWTAHDVAALVVLGKSLRSGEITRDEAFPATPVTSEQIAEQAAAAKRAAAKRTPPASAPTGQDPAPVQDPDGYDPTLEPGWGQDDAGEMDGAEAAAEGR